MKIPLSCDISCPCISVCVCNKYLNLHACVLFAKKKKKKEKKQTASVSAGLLYISAACLEESRLSSC